MSDTRFANISPHPLSPFHSADAHKFISTTSTSLLARGCLCCWCHAQEVTATPASGRFPSFLLTSGLGSTPRTAIQDVKAQLHSLARGISFEHHLLKSGTEVIQSLNQTPETAAINKSICEQPTEATVPGQRTQEAEPPPPVGSCLPGAESSPHCSPAPGAAAGPEQNLMSDRFPAAVSGATGGRRVLSL